MTRSSAWVPKTPYYAEYYLNSFGDEFFGEKNTYCYHRYFFTLSRSETQEF